MYKLKGDTWIFGGPESATSLATQVADVMTAKSDYTMNSLQHTLRASLVFGGGATLAPPFLYSYRTRSSKHFL